MSLKKSFSIIFCLLSGVLILFSLLGIGKTFQARLSDSLLTTTKPPASIVIVDIDEKSIHEIGQWPWPRVVFADLANKLKEAEAVGIDVNFKEPSRVGLKDDRTFTNALSAGKYVLSSELSNGQMIEPLLLLRGKAAEGFANLPVDDDGVVRNYFLSRYGYPSFSLALMGWDVENNADQSAIRIFYYGPAGTFTHLSFIDVLNGKIPVDIFRDKIVLIGATAKDLQDYHQTPFGLMSGVEIQANSVASLLEGKSFYSSRLVDLAVLILLIFLVLTLCFRLKKLRHMILSIVVLIIAFNLLVLILSDYLVIIDLLYTNLGIILSMTAVIIFQYKNTSQEKRFIQDSFSRYLSPHVIQELINDPSKLKLGGRKETLSILFSDIRSFTTLSETMTAEQLANFLNKYLSRMTDIVLDGRGLVDKYIGDAIMAFWGAPLRNETHAYDAIIVAVAMIEALEDFNEKNKGQYPAIDIGVGVNSGEVTVGNMGSEKRFDYTVIGDSVNLASRLEGLTKTYGVNIIVSETTLNLALADRDHSSLIVYREIDKVKVKGKTQPVTIFEIGAGMRKARIQNVIEQFNEAREAYYKGDWDSALKYLDLALQKEPNDGPSRLLHDRCLELRGALDLNWQGVFEHTHK